MHHGLPIVPILLVFAFFVAPAIIRAMFGGSSKRVPAATAKKQSRRSSFAQLSEIAREYESGDPQAARNLVAMLEQQIRGEGEPGVTAPLGVEFRNDAMASRTVERPISDIAGLTRLSNARAMTVTNAAMDVAAGITDPVLAEARKRAKSRQNTKHQKASSASRPRLDRDGNYSFGTAIPALDPLDALPALAARSALARRPVTPPRPPLSV